jgi:hypothetical protein
MDIKNLVTAEQFGKALQEVIDENWKVKMFMTGGDNKTLKGTFVELYDQFPAHLKPTLDTLLLIKFTPYLRSNTIKDILN